MHGRCVDHQSPAARRAVSTWLSDRLANINLLQPMSGRPFFLKPDSLMYALKYVTSVYIPRNQKEFRDICTGTVQTYGSTDSTVRSSAISPGSSGKLQEPCHVRSEHYKCNVTPILIFH